MIVIKIQGGLGNQLFQYATARSLSFELNKKLLFDLSFYDEERFKNVFRLNQYKIKIELADELEIRRIRNMKGPNKLSLVLQKMNISTKYTKRTHWYQDHIDSFYNKRQYVKHPIYLEGWFANPVYFENIHLILLKELYPNKLSNETLFWQEKIESSNSVSLHVRRGDYLKNNYFNNLPASYYNKAIDFFRKKKMDPEFYFFSDDMAFVKNEFKGINGVHFVDVNNKKDNYYSTIKDVEDLYLMSRCKHQVIANSTFSWWGAWLNKNPEKIIIAPKIWFINEQAQKRYDNGDLISKSWIKL
ncbi:MAG: alpha-1,2-fucosyltransferase [Bacteroidetes bacterium]|nr:alpha-1,2-fucosyltransferase [Bacteroidota bacterium]